MRRIKFVSVTIIALAALSYSRQHEHMLMSADSAVVQREMVGAILLSAPMSMEGSGTSWQPEASAMHMAMYDFDEWSMMIHGSVFPRYTHQGGLRGGKSFSSPNWFMASAQRMTGENSQIMFRMMLSLDRLTEGGDGYPLLLQTGETWQGKPLIDRQHPHDFFAEISTAVSVKLSNVASSYLYLGYPGEPALGPPAFMHRPSAVYSPDAPIGHHWQDATHISFGVATAGLTLSNIKVEGSLFTGKEPDEYRWDFDKPTFDSYSWRISVNPNEEFALQVSRGQLRNPKGNGDDVTRTTASVLHSKKISQGIDWSSSLIWGQNDEHHGAQNSYLVESAISLPEFVFYTRFENVEKPQEELGIFLDGGQIETVQQFSLGFVRKLGSGNGLEFNIGAQGSLYGLKSPVREAYGVNPFSFQIFLQIHPVQHSQASSNHEH